MMSNRNNLVICLTIFLSLISVSIIDCIERESEEDLSEGNDNSTDTSSSLSNVTEPLVEITREYG